MLSILLVTLGIILLAYSAFICRKLDFLDGFIKIRQLFAALFYLILFFVTGYVFFLYKLYLHYSTLIIYELVISLVFFFGAVFVYISLAISKKLIETINARSKSLDRINNELADKNIRLNEESEKLRNSEKMYKDKSLELEQTLEDYYTMRTVMLDREKKNNDKEIN